MGASGFTGVELLRIVDAHPDLELVSASADASAGSGIADMHPSLVLAHGSESFSAVDVDALRGLDLVFLCLPHEASLELAPQLVDQVGCVVDLLAAFRLTDTSAYPTYYGFEHSQPELLELV